jgi:hypothetical protein
VPRPWEGIPCNRGNNTSDIDQRNCLVYCIWDKEVARLRLVRAAPPLLVLVHLPSSPPA